MIDLRSATLLELLPESIRDDADLVALSLALDPELRAIANDVVEAVILPNVANLPETVCDALAWDHRFNEMRIWDLATLAGKRAILSIVLDVRKKAGTAYAVRQIFGLLSHTGRVIPGFQESAGPYTYRLVLTISSAPLTLGQILAIPEWCERFEGTRDNMTEFAVEAEGEGELFIYPALTVGRHSEIPFGGP